MPLIPLFLHLIYIRWNFLSNHLLKNYPQLEKEDILAAIEYSLEILKGEKIFSI
jgi:uncharacterized protein (DUF433 family)